MRSLDEKVAYSSSEMTRESSANMEELTDLQKIITDDLPRLVDDLKSEITDREDSDNTMLKKFSEELQELTKELET